MISFERDPWITIITLNSLITCFFQQEVVFPKVVCNCHYEIHFVSRSDVKTGNGDIMI